nr:hypothetical protein MmNV_79 [Menippe mercenaria nudivirus]
MSTSENATSASSIQFPCFHNKLSEKVTNVSSCKYVVGPEMHHHVIALRDAVSYDTLPQLSSVTYNLNKHDAVSEVCEKISIQPLCSLYSLDKRTDVSMVLTLASQLIEYFITILLLEDRRFTNITRENDCIHFLNTHAAFALDNKNEARFIILNRHMIQTQPLPEKQKAKKMISMLFSTSIMCKVLLFCKNKKSTQKTIQPCHKSACKLSTYTPRFLNMYNDDDLLVKLHFVFCSSFSDVDIFTNLYQVIPISSTMLNEAVKYVQYCSSF